MFDFLKKNKKNAGNLTKLNLKISGMHCTSCATNIDLTLEDIDGVKSANTNYQKMIVKVEYDPKRVDLKAIQKGIDQLGYSYEKMD